MAVYKVTLATKDGERKVKYIYPKTSADIVEYSNNKSVYAKIEELEYLINSIPKFKIRVVTELPTLDISETTVYLVKAQTEDTKNIFSEYIYVNNEWELLGVQTIDLSIYYTIDQIDEIVESLMEGINSKADINHIHSNVTPNPNGTAGFMSPEDKSKLDDIANGAQVNTIESIKVNNNAIVPNASDKSVNITIDKSTVGLNNVANINQSGAIKDITRDGITFTATKLDGTTLTFTQQDNNTTYSAGNGLSLEGTEFKLDHPISGVTQGTYGSAIKVPQIVVDDKGHITSAVNKNIPVMTKATSSVAGTAGFVPAPASGKQNSFLRGDATWSLPTKSDVGLGNVDNTKDVDKPISTATQTALNNKSDINHNHDSEYANIDHAHTKDEIIDLTEATTTKSGLMSSADKNKLDNIGSSGATNTSITRHLSQGTKIATITIDGTNTDLYCEKNTDTNKYHKNGSWNGLKYTAQAVNNAEELSFTIPTGTSSTTVAVGNHNHDSAYAAKSHTHTKSEITDLDEATTTKSGLMSSADKNKLDNIASGAEANVQSDWNQSDTTADDFIKNKPTNASASAAGLMSAADFKKINPQGIADNTDLNSITADGWYYCSTNATVATLSHCPTDKAFYLEVHKHAGVYQHIVEYSDTGAKHFHRNCYHEWGSWVEWKLTDTTYSAATTTTSGLMSAADKSKLNGIESGAEANVQSDWNQSDTTADDFIKNKPSNLVQDANYVHTDNNFTNAEKTEVDTLIAGAEEVVFTIQNDNTLSIDISPQPANLTTFWVNLWNSCSETETPVSTFNKRFVLKDTRNIDNADEYIYINITNIMRASPSGFAVRFIGQKINNGDIYVFNVESNLETDIDSGDSYISSMYFEFKIPQLENTPTIVDTIADFSTLNLYLDQVIITKGYSSVGDGGGSTYIVSETEPDVPWFISINDFYIGIEKKDEYSAAELGMFPNDENNTTKFNTLKAGCKCTIRFSAGTYLWDSLLITRDNHLYSFIGTNDKSPYPSYDWLTNHKNYIGSSTFFAPYWNGEGPSAYPRYQSYVMKIGGTIGGIDLYNVGQKDQEGNILCANDEDENNFSNYYFTGFNIKDISFTDAGKHITDSLLIIEYCSCINGNLQFKNSTCQCLKMRNCWEMFFDFISIRSCILPFPTSALWTMEDYTQRSANISALTVNLLDVENFKSTILRISEKANFCASTINMVQIEGSLSKNKEHTLENGDKELALDGNTKTIDNVVYGVHTGNFVDLGKTEEELAEVDAATGLSLYEQGISTYELAIKIPLIDYTNVNAVIINSISLQSVGYQWWYWDNDSSVKYVHSLLRGVGGFSIGMIAIDTVFHYFTINDNAANGWARFTDIAMIKCDKTQLIPAPIGGVTHDYRFITNGSTNIFKSTIPVFQGSYPDNIYLKSLIEQCGSPTPQLISYQIGVSPTAANVSAKTVSLSDFELESGVRACVKFAYPDNGGSSPTLNINNTGAKPICISHTVINSETGERETVIENINAGYLKANKTYQFAYNGSQYLIISTGTRAIMSIEGRHEVAIVPRTIGSCEKISAIFSMTNANLYVRRYLNDTLIHETSFPVSTSYTVRILELLVLNSNQELVRKNYDSYEVIYVPDLSSSELAIINDNTKTKEEKIAELAALERPHNLALSYLKIE